MIHLVLTLLLAPQEISTTDAVQREVRLHAVGELIAPPAHPYAQLLTDGLTMQLDQGAPGTYLLYPRLLYATEAFVRGDHLRGQYLLETVPYLQPQRDEHKFASIHELEEIATRFCQPPLDPRHERIQADAQGWLVCYLRPEQHEWLQRFLELQHEGERHWLADVSTEWFTIQDDAVASLQMEGSALLLDDAASLAQMRARLERASVERISSPRLTAFPGQRAEISTLNDVSYVKEYKLEIVEPGRQEIADPVVDVIQEGVVMNVRVMQADEARYGLRLECASSQLERPIPTRRFRLSPAHPTEVEVAMPQLRTAKVEATVLMPDGGGVLLLASGLADGRSLAILVSFRRAPLAQEPDATGER